MQRKFVKSQAGEESAIGNAGSVYPSRVIAEERCGSQFHKYVIAYDFEAAEETLDVDEQSFQTPLEDEKPKPLTRTRSGSWVQKTQQLLRHVFLPQGYPASVSPDYLSYQKWEVLQYFCYSFTSFLSIQAILQGVGVGESSASAAAATVQWFVMDCTGMFGRILFAWAQGSKLDSNCKLWRFLSDVLIDVGAFLELISPMFPKHFLAIACVGTLIKATAGVAGASTRAAFMEHQARKNNMADVAAKGGSQETAASLLGMLLGMLIIPLLSGSAEGLWCLFLLFALCHIFANYMAVRALTLETLNRQRAYLLISHFLETGRVLSPAQIAQRERVLAWETMFEGTPRAALGVRLYSIAPHPRMVVRYIRCYANERYLLGLVSTPSTDATASTIGIVLEHHATSVDEIKALFQAVLLQRMLVEVQHREQHAKNEEISHYRIDDVVERSYDAAAGQWHAFYQGLLDQQWVVDRNVLGAGEWRAHWNMQELQAVPVMANLTPTAEKAV